MRSKSIAAVCVAMVCATPLFAQEHEERPQLALMGTVPIYWGEADGLTEVIEGSAPQHWARALLERNFTLAPLDFLTEESLALHQFLLMAQPRGLAAQENVALDAWVRDGGKLLLFADPMMTGYSRFNIGDRRRPQDVTLLSPILTHWGVELQFDESQDAGVGLSDRFHFPIPVSLAGEFVPLDGRFECTIPGGGLVAHCVLGIGQVMMVADAAVLDLEGPHGGAPEALTNLLEHLFGPFGESAGITAHDVGHDSENPIQIMENQGHGPEPSEETSHGGPS